MTAARLCVTLVAVHWEEVLSTISAQDISHKIVILISNFLTIKNCVFLSQIKLNKIKILFNLGEMKSKAEGD